jgi:hemerythrin-like metal-binding protein
MARIEWQDCYSVNNERIDQQHKRIVAMINQLGEAMENGSERPALIKILSDLAGYTKTHFKDEECLMEEHAYPDLVEHRQRHVDLNRRLADFYRNFYTGSRPHPDEIMAFLQSWLFDHILEQDKLYAPYLKGN